MTAADICPYGLVVLAQTAGLRSRKPLRPLQREPAQPRRRRSRDDPHTGAAIIVCRHYVPAALKVKVKCVIGKVGTLTSCAHLTVHVEPLRNCVARSWSIHEDFLSGGTHEYPFKLTSLHEVQLVEPEPLRLSLTPISDQAGLPDRALWIAYEALSELSRRQIPQSRVRTKVVVILSPRFDLLPSILKR